MQRPTLFKEAAVLEPVLQELEELMELDPKRLSEEDLDDSRKEVIEVNLGVLLSALFPLWLHRLYHLTF